MAAGDDEDFGSAHITIDLDDDEATGDADSLGNRIRRALIRATSDLGVRIRRNIQRGLAAGVSVKVVPDLSDFESTLLAGLGTSGQVEVPVIPDLSGFDALVRGHRVPDLPVALLPDFDRLDRLVRGHKLPQLTADVLPDLRRFDAALLDGLSSLRGINIPVLPDLDGFVARIRALLAGQEVSIRVVPDLDGFDARIRAHNAPDVSVNVNPDVDTNRLTQALSGVAGLAGRVGSALGGLLQLGAVGIAAAAAAQGLVVFGAALAPAIGILAAAPAAIAVAGAAFGTLQLALSGVKEAFSSALTGSAEEFEASLENLSPKARAAAREVRALKPAFDKLKSAVQDNFFGQIEGQITKTSSALGGPLSKGLKGVSTAWGRVASEALKALASQRGVAAVTSVFGAAESAVGGLADSTRGVTDGLLAIVNSVSEAFGKKLGGAIGGVGDRLGKFLVDVADSGRAVSWVSQAIVVFRELGGIVTNVGSIIKSIFDVARASGGDLLGNIREVTGALRAFLNSDAGESALTGIFTTIGEIASQVGPILTDLVSLVGQVAPLLAPVFAELGPAIQGLIAAAAPLLTEFAPSLEIIAAGLGDLFANLDVTGLGSAIGEVLEALAPILPLVGELASGISTVLGPVLENLARLFGPIIREIADALLPVLPKLSASLARVAEAVKPIVSALGEGLGDAIKELLPPLLEQLPKLVDELLPAFEKLAEVLTPLIPKLIQLAVKAIKPLIPLLPKFVSYVRKLVEIFTSMLEKGVEVVNFFQELDDKIKSFGAAAEEVGTKIGEFVTGVLDYFRNLYNELVGQSIIPDLINGIIDWFAQLPSRVLETLVGFVDSVVLYFSELPGKIAEQLLGLGSSLLTALGDGFTQGLDAVIRFTGQVVDYLTALPGRAAQALVNYGTLLYERLRSAGSTAYTAVTEFAGRVVTYLRAMPGRAYDALASLGGRLAERARTAGASLISEINSFIGRAIDYVRRLPARAADALGGIRSALVQAGRDMIGGFISGVRQRASDLVSAARDVISGAIDAADSVLDFGSPSKVFIKIGKDTGQGFIIGLTGTAAQVRAATLRVTEGVIKIGRQIGIGFVKSLTGNASTIKATTTKLANDIASAFRGVKTTVDDRLITLVQTSNQRLQALVVQREENAKRLAAAQKFATDTSQAALSAFSLQSIAQDAGEGALTADVLVRGLKAAVAQVKAFDAQVASLARRGLDKSLLEQVIGLGAENGADLATALTRADRATFSRLNDLQKTLTQASDKLGKTGADALFDSGVAAGKGFLAGIKSEQKAIEKLMLDIAKGMQRAIKAALDIRSPSHVFYKIGELTGVGLQGGLLSRLGALQDAARTAARGVVTSVSSEFARMAGAPALSGVSFGEGGDVIPLTRAQRSRQQAQASSGLGEALKGMVGKTAGGGQAAGGRVLNQTINITEVGDGRATAHRVVTRLALAAGL